MVLKQEVSCSSKNFSGSHRHPLKQRYHYHRTQQHLCRKHEICNYTGNTQRTNIIHLGVILSSISLAHPAN